MKSDEKAFLKHTRKVLDESADALDAATLSRLNQARQKALHSVQQSVQQSQQQATRRYFMAFKMPAVVAASVSIALFGSWLMLSQTQQTGLDKLALDQLAYDDEDINMLVSDTELELLEQLEFVSWLVVQELEENNAG